MYAPRLMKRLGVPGGVVRASLVHYNTLDEIARFGESLTAVVKALGERAAGRRC
jgi:selenocysteine lyase/cysteine desulfurase